MIRHIGIYLLPAMLSLAMLAGCADDGAGGFSELSGSWQGSWQQGGIPSALLAGNYAHASSGTISVDLTESIDGSITGTVTMDPDICAEGTERSQPLVVVISGSLTQGTLTFSYSSPNVSPEEEVLFSASFPADPMLGDYDGSSCSNNWVGGFRMDKQ